MIFLFVCFGVKARDCFGFFLGVHFITGNDGGVYKMLQLNIKLPEQTALRARELSQRLNISLDDFVLKSIEEKLANQKQFETAVDYVMTKNSELYRRLAK